MHWQEIISISTVLFTWIRIINKRTILSSCHIKKQSIIRNWFTITPEIISPGEKANVKIDFQNTELSSLEDVVVKLDLSNTTLPFAPIQSGTEQTIKTISPEVQHH